MRVKIANHTMDSETAIALADRFKILADPTRVRLLSVLAERELCVSELTQLLEMEQSAVSHQLRTLRSWELVQFRKVGRQVYYRLNDRHIQELLSRSLAHMENV
jgi:ArsR family transcriptional regulator, lead/cadmium/zinc/bismuth-responsive transcriptional repressor